MPSLFSNTGASRSRRLLASGGMLAFALAGCATIEQRLPAGTPASEVLAAMGEPAITCPLPDGGRRLVWSGQPFMQASWASDIDAADRSGGVEQVLTDASFARLNQGGWDRDKVRCAFGPPAEISTVGLPGSRQLVWSYAYKQDTVWNSLMHIYFDAAGHVTRHHPGPDPTYDVDERFFGSR